MHGSFTLSIGDSIIMCLLILLCINSRQTDRPQAYLITIVSDQSNKQSSAKNRKRGLFAAIVNISIRRVLYQLKVNLVVDKVISTSFERMLRLLTSVGEQAALSQPIKSNTSEWADYFRCIQTVPIVMQGRLSQNQTNRGQTSAKSFLILIFVAGDA